ncbi:leucine-rich repeat and IQ domain-containing protein 3 isoform X2 [Erythrolamprus reginae]|uniref:leucine-rich repeat and IQ domain-containing protein 3 isoform X2 n=1 Tax=Erythrolamprus reginae TaxID=121349 RepID=UPI00396C7DDB
MEEEFLEYLVCVSKELLLEYGQTAKERDAKKLRNLVMLELLPGPMFWRYMKNLQLLYLHDNGISTLEDVHSLSFCPNLIALTLYNTPLCLKIAYRHIVVNSIFSLKALDYYVISDEEITEGWRLPEKYKPFTLDFFVDYYPFSAKETTFQEEMKTVRNIISKINHVLVHHSPVLIIQRWIRGYLSRKILCVSPISDVLWYNRFTRGRKKLVTSVDDKSPVSEIVKQELPTRYKRGTPAIQIIDMNNLKEFRLTLRILRYPVIRVEEKKKFQQKEPKSPKKEREKTEMKFRLSGSKMPFYSPDEHWKMYKEKEREFFYTAHDIRYITHPEPQKLPILEPGSIEKRVFAKAYGTVRLHPLYAIEQAYWQSRKLDLQAKKERDVMRSLIAKSEAKEYLHHLREDKIDNIQRNYEKEKMMDTKNVKKSKEGNVKFLVKMRKKYNNFLEKKEGKLIENSFIQRFSTQHTSLTRGLLKLDGWRKTLQIQKERKKLLEGIRQEQKERKQVYGHFQEERRQMIQKQNIQEKIFRKCVTQVVARERFEQSKAKLRAVKEPHVKRLYSLPVIGSSSNAKPVAKYNR